MTGPLPAAIAAILAVVVIGGAVVAVGNREQRPAILGLLLALSGAPFLSDPLADPRGIAARIAGAALVAYLFLIAARDDTEPADEAAGTPPLSWPVAALVAGTAALVAVAAVLGSNLPGPAGVSGGGGVTRGEGLPEPPGAPLLAAAPFVPAAAAGAALLLLAAAPIVLAAGPQRLAQALVLGVAGTVLVVAGVTGPPSPFVDLCLALLLAVIAGVGGLLHQLERRAPGQSAPR